MAAPISRIFPNNISLKLQTKIFRFSISQHRHFKNVTSVDKILLQPTYGDTVEIQGWVKSLRKQKDITFLHLNDGASPQQIQVVLPTASVPQQLTTNASVVISGEVVESPGAKQPTEIKGDQITILSLCKLEDGFPFAPRKAYPLEYLRGFPHLRPKTKIGSSLLRLTSLVNLSLHNTLTDQGFCHVYTPTLTSNDCEGGSEVFLARPEDEKLCEEMNKSKRLEEAFFDRKVYLTVSSQLHLEAMANGLSKVYTLSPTFRAENSRSRRHLAEFRMLEAELSFCSNLDPLLHLMETLIKKCSENLLEKGNSDIKIVEDFTKEDIKGHLENLRKIQFAVLPYTEAISLLLKHREKFQHQPTDGADLGSEHENFIVDYLGGQPTFITEWPQSIKPFYMRTKDGHPNIVDNVDLLVPGVGELCGGSLREHRYEVLKPRIDSLNLGGSLDWYADLRRFGGSPTGGFGMGVERLLLYLLRMTNVRDIVPFPRWPHHCPM